MSLLLIRPEDYSYAVVLSIFKNEPMPMLKRKKTQDVSRNSVLVLYEYACVTEEVAQFWDVKLKSRLGSRGCF